MSLTKFDLRHVLDQDAARTLAHMLAIHLTLLPPTCANAVVATDEDVYWASERGIHSLAMTWRYGGHPVTCISLLLGKLLGEGLGGRATNAEWDRERHEVRWTIGDRVLAYDYRASSKIPGNEHVWREVCDVGP